MSKELATSPEVAETEPCLTDSSAEYVSEKPAVEDYQQRMEHLLDATETALDLVEQEEAGVQAALDVKLSVAMPVYNEAGTLREIVQQVMAVPLDIELIIVDDCSTDGTHEILLELEQNPKIKVFYHQFNHGKGAALRTAFLQATGDLVIVQDADLEYDPSDYPSLIQPILEGKADVVYGSRFLGDEVRDPSFIHRLGNRLLTGASNLLTRQKLTDMETCYKVFRRDLLIDIDIQQDRFGFEPEITAKLSRRNQKICEVPIAYQGRGFNEGKKIGIKDAFNALYCIIRYSLAD